MLYAAILITVLLAQSTDTLKEARVRGVQEGNMLFAGDTAGRRRLSQAAGVADAIREFSGVQLKDYGGVGGLKTVNVRSLGSEHVGVFMDGIQIDNAQNMQVDLGRFSTDALERIEICNGLRTNALQSAKEYGTGAAVHLIAAPPRRNGRLVRVKGGSFGTAAASVKMDRLFPKRCSGSLTGEMVSTDGRYKFPVSDFGYDTVLVRENGDFRSFRAEAQLFGQNWDMKAYWFDSERGLPGAVVRRPYVMPLGLDRQTDRNFFIQGHFRQDLGRGWSMAVRAKYAYDFLHYLTRPEADPQAMPYDNTYRQQNAYLSVSHLFRIRPWWQLSIAADGQYSCLDANLRDFVYPHRFTGYFAVSDSFLWSRFRLSASLLCTVASDRFEEPDAGGFTLRNRTRTVLCPSLMAQYEPVRGLALSAFAKRSYRMPSFNDLYYTLVGNSNLRPEDVWQFDLGIGCSVFNGLSAKAEIYCNRVTDKIVALPSTSQFRWSMYNIGRADILGADIRIGLRHGGRTADAGLMVKYTFQRAVDHTDAGKSTYGCQIAYAPRHSGSFSADLTWKGFRIDWITIVTGERSSTASRLPDYRIEPFATTDIRLSKSIVLRASALAFRLSLNNLFDRHYSLVQGYPMPGFNALASAEYVF